MRVLIGTGRTDALQGENWASEAEVSLKDEAGGLQGELDLERPVAGGRDGESSGAGASQSIEEKAGFAALGDDGGLSNAGRGKRAGDDEQIRRARDNLNIDASIGGRRGNKTNGGGDAQVLGDARRVEGEEGVGHFEINDLREGGNGEGGGLGERELSRLSAVRTAFSSKFAPTTTGSRVSLGGMIRSRNLSRPGRMGKRPSIVQQEAVRDAPAKPDVPNVDPPGLS